MTNRHTKKQTAINNNDKNFKKNLFNKTVKTLLQRAS